jgi:hypothetical protein
VAHRTSRDGTEFLSRPVALPGAEASLECAGTGASLRYDSRTMNVAAACTRLAVSRAMPRFVEEDLNAAPG